MSFRKNYLLLFYYLLLQKALFSQFIGFGVRSYNTTILVRPSTCKGLNGETLKTFIENDSLYFVNANGAKQAICQARNKGGPELNNAPVIAIDKSSGSNKGRIYLCWSSEKNGLKNKDVFITYSDDNGNTWIDPILVTYRPNHRAQVMPAITVNPSDGAVYLLYHDSQNYFENIIDTDVYLAISNNGGLKFDYYKLNNAPLKITLNTQERSYLKLTVENEIVTASWNQIGKKKSALTTVTINEVFFANYQKQQINEIRFEKTIRFSNEIKIEFTSTTDTKLTAAVTKPLLAGYEKLVVKNLSVKKGNNQLLIDTAKLGLQKGNYVLTLYYNGKNDFIWITEE